MRVPVVVVADGMPTGHGRVARVHALLVLEADRDVLGGQDVDVAERHHVVVVVAHDAVHHLVGEEQAGREQDRHGRLRDQLRGHDVAVEPVVVQTEGVDRARVRVLPHAAHGKRRHPHGVEGVLVEELQLRADVVGVDRLVAVLVGVDEPVAAGDLHAVGERDRRRAGPPVDAGVVEVHVPRAHLRTRHLAVERGMLHGVRRVASVVSVPWQACRVGEGVEGDASRALQVVERHARRRTACGGDRRREREADNLAC